MQPAVKIALTWALILMCLALPAAGQMDERDSAAQYYTVKVWGADDGLTEGSVTDVAQTPEGYLWVGTLFGSVLRFDGTRFVSFNSANTPEFSQKWGVPRMMVDKTGMLWIRMYDGGMTTWDKQGFHSALTSTNGPDRMLWSAPGKAVFAFGDGRVFAGKNSGGQWLWETNALENAASPSQACADSTGRIWYLRADRNLGVWDGHGCKTVSPSAGLAEQKIKILLADPRGHIWVGTDQALAEWQEDHFQIRTPTNGEAALEIKRIIPSGPDLWVETTGRLRRYSGGQWATECNVWEQEMGKLPALRFIHGDTEGGLWTSAGDLGLVHVLPDGTLHRLTTRDGLPSNTIHWAYQDHDGNTWTGYERGGLVQIRRRLFQSIGKAEGLNDTLINTVCEDPQGRVWIGTHSGAVVCYEHGVATNLALPPKITRPQDSCVVPDAQGRVWIGAQGAGLMLSENGEVRRIATPQFQGAPRLLLAARDGHLWVGSLWSILSVTDGVPTIQFTAQAVGDHPTALAEATDGTIWAGTLAGFLMRWDGGKFIPVIPPDQNSLGRIWALYGAADGSLWAGTEEGGLLHYHNGKFFRYTTQNGLPSDSIVQVQGDAQGNLWLGTRAGITRVSGAKLNLYERGEISQLPVSVYGKPDGLPTIGSSMIFQPNCWQGRDGTLFFAMASGIATVKPEEVRLNQSPPMVALEEVHVDDQPVWPGRVGAVLTPAQADPHEPQGPPGITVGPGRGDLEFRYTGLSFGSPSRVRFRYRLEGWESGWNEAGVEVNARYRHVSPGAYVFHVIAGNSDGFWSADGSLLAVVIRPHFYQTFWFRGGMALLTLTGLSLAVAVSMRRRMRRRMEQLKRQHELERERTRIAQDLHDELGAGLTEIGLLGGMLQKPSQFLGKHEALGRIVQRCHDLVMALDEIVWAVNPRNDSVNSLSGYLSRYAQGFFEPTPIRCRLEMHEAEPDRPLNSEQRHNLFLAFEEALANIAKHSGAKVVNIRLALEETRRLVIRIEDDGRGLPAAIPEGSNGLNNLRQRMAHIGGQCEIGNRPEGGVAVTLSLGLRN